MKIRENHLNKYRNIKQMGQRLAIVLFVPPIQQLPSVYFITILEELIMNKETQLIDKDICIDNIIELRNKGLSIQKVAEELGTNKTKICRMLHNAGIRTRNYMHARSGVPITEKYRKGKSIEDLATEYNAHPKTIISLLRQNGEMINFRPKYSVDDTYFSNIDDQNKAYILGLIYADGNVSDSNFSISLQERDMHILDSIRVLMGSTNPLKYINQKKKSETFQNQYKLSIYNKKIVQDLNNYGVMKNKSLKIKFPKFLSDELFPHFLRGLFDGDGLLIKNIM